MHDHIVMCYEILRRIELLCTLLYCTVLYCTVLYCTVLYCTVLYCTALHLMNLLCWGSLTHLKLFAFQTPQFCNVIREMGREEKR